MFDVLYPFKKVFSHGVRRSLFQKKVLKGLFSFIDIQNAQNLFNSTEVNSFKSDSMHGIVAK